MREIKFRAWDKLYEQMRYGYMKLCQLSYGELIVTGYWDNKEIRAEEDQFIIEQYTGKKDETGKEIYENDIVKSGYLENDIWKDDFAVIKWDNEVCLWIQYFNNGMEQLMDVDCRIMGNIHENPELLEMGKNEGQN